MAVKYNSDPPFDGEFAARDMAELGLALVDLASDSIALDEGAASILSAVSDEDWSRAGSVSRRLPPVILEQIRQIRLCQTGSNEMHFIAGNQCYSARAHPMHTADAAASRPWIMLRFERDADASDALAELSMTCRLTDREKEALRAIALGLTSKEVAQRMNISLSTVKVFLRLIKIKTGARNRADIVARLLCPASTTAPDPRDRPWHDQDAIRSSL